jgi:hypothetical protein
VTNELGQPLINPSTQKPIRRSLAPLPGSFLKFQDGTTVGQLTGASANETTWQALWGLLSYITTVPVFKFSDGGALPSGVALIQAEAALNHRVESYQGFLSGPMEQVLRLSIKLGNVYARLGLPEDTTLVVPFASPVVYTQDLILEMEHHSFDMAVNRYQAGLASLETTLAALHPKWSPEEIQQEITRIKNEKQEAADAAIKQAQATRPPTTISASSSNGRVLS